MTFSIWFTCTSSIDHLLPVPLTDLVFCSREYAQQAVWTARELREKVRRLNSTYIYAC